MILHLVILFSDVSEDLLWTSTNMNIRINYHGNNITIKPIHPFTTDTVASLLFTDKQQFINKVKN